MTKSDGFVKSLNHPLLSFPRRQGFSEAKKFNIFCVGYQKLVSVSITNKNSRSNYDKLNMAVL